MTIPASIAVGGHATDAEIVDAQNAVNAILALLSGQPSSGAGTTTQVLHGGAAGFAVVSLTADVSGTLPVANGGTGVTAVIHLQAYTGAGQSIANGAGAIVVFGTVEDDSASAYNSGTGVFTIPVMGIYAIDSSIAYANAQVGSVTISLRINGNNNRTFTFVNPGANQSVGIGGLYKLAAGDTLSIWTTQPAAGAQSLNTSAVNNFLFVAGPN